MSKRSENDLLQDIAESIERIISYTANVHYEQFKKDFFLIPKLRLRVKGILRL